MVPPSARTAIHGYSTSIHGTTSCSYSDTWLQCFYPWYHHLLVQRYMATVLLSMVPPSARTAIHGYSASIHVTTICSYSDTWLQCFYPWYHHLLVQRYMATVLLSMLPPSDRTAIHGYSASIHGTTICSYSDAWLQCFYPWYHHLLVQRYMAAVLLSMLPPSARTPAAGK